MGTKVTILPAGDEIAVDADTPVLAAALAAGLNLPHSCRGGNCGACRARVLSGEFHYPHGRPLGISDAEIASGMALLCQARALSDMRVEIRTVSLAAEARIKRLPCRIARTERLSHDVIGAYLRLPAAEDFKFQAGQYIDILLSGGRRRSFSIASAPDLPEPSQTPSLLELHIRHVPGGAFTEPLFSQAADGKLLTIEGPLGQFVYRESSAPMLLIGGGTGFAPLKSIIDHVVRGDLGRQMTLFWGCRAEPDLYAEAWIRAIAQRVAHFRHVPVLSEGSPAWTGARGFVHEEVLRQMADLSAYDIYASGPPAMVNAVRREFGARGADPARIYFDSFDYAPDSVDRHRSTAPTSS